MPAAIASVKISILLLYLRIFPSPRFRLIVWSVSCFVLCCCITQTLLIIFQCRPVKAAWDLEVKGQCIRLNLTYVILGSFNALTDIIAPCLPMPFLWVRQEETTLPYLLQFGIGSNNKLYHSRMPWNKHADFITHSWRLHTDKTRKTQLIGTFGLGTLWVTMMYLVCTARGLIGFQYLCR